MAILKTGIRLKSTVCNGEVMVVAAPDGEMEISCGGQAMADPASAEKNGDVDADHAVGIAIGKRYVNEAGDLELLCVKAGEGSLAVGGELLLQKDTKKLPKTD